jgi:hypothetical protein
MAAALWQMEALRLPFPYRIDLDDTLAVRPGESSPAESLEWPGTHEKTFVCGDIEPRSGHGPVPNA